MASYKTLGKYCTTCRKYEGDDEDVRENFCPSCLIGPMVIVGVGAAGVSMTASKKHQLQKKVLLWSGVLIVLSAAGIGIYYLANKKNCLSCTIKN